MRRGAQTVILAANSPEAHITSVDISETSIAEARERIERTGFTNISFRQGNIFKLPFPPASFDHVFVCFVLEHMANPVEALPALKQRIRQDGTITPPTSTPAAVTPTVRSAAKSGCNIVPAAMRISDGNSTRS